MITQFQICVNILLVDRKNDTINKQYCRKAGNHLRCYVAPMEGITGYLFRRLHHTMFPGAEKYYLPFFSPAAEHIIPPRQLRDLLPENNDGVPAVPQILTKNAADFTWTERQLREMGYEEINLNLGCPSGTVTAKGKGSGFLAYPDALEQFLDAIFSAATGPISVKTRLGVYRPEEFDLLLTLYNRYPILELTVHARTRQDFYKLPVHPAAFAQALEESCNPVCCNGDLITASDCAAFKKAHPAVEAVMLGRGVVANPAVIRQVNGGAPAAREELRAFHDALLESYRTVFGNDEPALQRMKEVWFYMGHLFEGAERLLKQLRKSHDLALFQAAAQEILAHQPLRQEASGVLPYEPVIGSP